MRRGEARRGEKRNEPRCGAERSGAERSGSACLDRDVATVWPSYALLPLLLSFSEPHFSLLHCLSVCLSRSVSLYTTTTVATRRYSPWFTESHEPQLTLSLYNV